MSKAKVELELNLARDAKSNKKCFYRDVKQKRKVKEGIFSPMNNTAKMAITDENKTGVLINIFASVFNDNFCSLASQVDREHIGDHISYCK